MKSKFLSLQAKDWIRGLFMSVSAAIVDALILTLNSGAMPTPEQYKGIAITGGVAGLVYISKNLLTNSQDEFVKPEPKSK